MEKPRLKDFDEYTEGLPVAAEAYVAAVMVAVIPVIAFGLGSVTFRVMDWYRLGFQVIGR